MSDHCSEPGCDRTARARTLCGSHYRRAWRNGTLPLAQPRYRGGRPATEIREQLAIRVTDLEIALSIAHHHAGMLLERWGHMTSDELHEHLLLLHQESKAGAVPDCQDGAA